MIIKSSLRLSTFILVACWLSLMGYVLYFLYDKHLSDIRGSFPWQALVGGLIYLTVTIYLCYKFLFRLVILSIDPEEKIITAFYPLQFRKLKFSFDEFNGFYFSQHQGRMIAFKVLVIVSGEKKIRLSDFETVNLAEIEEFLIHNFKLLDKDSLLPLDEEKKKKFLETVIREFDIEQVKAIRFTCWTWIIFFVLFFSWEIFLQTGGRPIPRLVNIMMSAFLIFCIQKLFRANQNLRALQSSV